VSARVSGHVIKLNVQDNQYVEKERCCGNRSSRLRSGGGAGARGVCDAKAQADAAGINVPITDVSTTSR